MESLQSLQADCDYMAFPKPSHQTMRTLSTEMWLETGEDCPDENYRRVLVAMEMFPQPPELRRSKPEQQPALPVLKCQPGYQRASASYIVTEGDVISDLDGGRPFTIGTRGLFLGKSAASIRKLCNNGVEVQCPIPESERLAVKPWWPETHERLAPGEKIEAGDLMGNVFHSEIVQVAPKSRIIGLTEEKANKTYPKNTLQFARRKPLPPAEVQAEQPQEAVKSSEQWPPEGMFVETDPKYTIQKGDWVLLSGKGEPELARALIGVSVAHAASCNYMVACPVSREPAQWPPEGTENIKDGLIQEGDILRFADGHVMKDKPVLHYGKPVSDWLNGLMQSAVARPIPHYWEKKRWNELKETPEPGVRVDAETNIRHGWDARTPKHDWHGPEAETISLFAKNAPLWIDVLEYRVYPLETQKEANERIVREYEEAPEGKQLECRHWTDEGWKVERDIDHVKLRIKQNADYLRFRIMPHRHSEKQKQWDGLTRTELPEERVDAYTGIRYGIWGGIDSENIIRLIAATNCLQWDSPYYEIRALETQQEASIRILNKWRDMTAEQCQGQQLEVCSAPLKNWQPVFHLQEAMDHITTAAGSGLRFRIQPVTDIQAIEKQMEERRQSEVDAVRKEWESLQQTNYRFTQGSRVPVKVRLDGVGRMCVVMWQYTDESQGKWLSKDWDANWILRNVTQGRPMEYAIKLLGRNDVQQLHLQYPQDQVQAFFEGKWITLGKAKFDDPKPDYRLQPAQELNTQKVTGNTGYLLAYGDRSLCVHFDEQGRWIVAPPNQAWRPVTAREVELLHKQHPEAVVEYLDGETWKVLQYAEADLADATTGTYRLQPAPSKDNRAAAIEAVRKEWLAYTPVNFPYGDAEIRENAKGQMVVREWRHTEPGKGSVLSWNMCLDSSWTGTSDTVYQVRKLTASEVKHLHKEHPEAVVEFLTGGGVWVRIMRPNWGNGSYYRLQPAVQKAEPEPKSELVTESETPEPVPFKYFHLPFNVARAEQYGGPNGSQEVVQIVDQSNQVVAVMQLPADSFGANAGQVIAEMQRLASYLISFPGLIERSRRDRKKIQELKKAVREIKAQKEQHEFDAITLKKIQEDVAKILATREGEGVFAAAERIMREMSDVRLQYTQCDARYREAQADHAFAVKERGAAVEQLVSLQSTLTQARDKNSELNELLHQKRVEHAKSDYDCAKLRKELRLADDQIKSVQAASKGFCEAIVRQVQPLFVEGARALDWDVLPSTIGRLIQELTSFRQAEKTGISS